MGGWAFIVVSRAVASGQVHCAVSEGCYAVVFVGIRECCYLCGGGLGSDVAVVNGRVTGEWKGAWRTINIYAGSLMETSSDL